MPSLQAEFTKAAAAGDIARMEDLAAQGADPSAPPREGMAPPIVRAAEKYQAVAVEWFILHGVDVDAPTGVRGCSCVLDHLLRTERPEVLDATLRALTVTLGSAEAARIKIFDTATSIVWYPGGRTTRWLAVYSLPPREWRNRLGRDAVEAAKHIDPSSFIDHILKAYAGPVSKQTQKARVVQEAKRSWLAAAKAGDVGALRAALSEGIDINIAISGKTALFEAAYAGKAEAVAYLLSAGADHKFRSPNSGKDALCTALSGKHWETALTILQSGHQFTDDGSFFDNSPQHAAAFRGGPGIVLDALRASGFNLDRELDGARPIHYAAIEGQYETFLELVRLGSRSDVRSRNNRTPLMWLLGSSDVVMTEDGTATFAKNHWKRSHTALAHWLIEQLGRGEIAEINSRIVELTPPRTYARRHDAALQAILTAPGFDFRQLIPPLPKGSGKTTAHDRD